jgi:hypothetical protein
MVQSSHGAIQLRGGACSFSPATTGARAIFANCPTYFLLLLNMFFGQLPTTIYVDVKMFFVNL